MSGPPVLPRMDWDACHPSDRSGVVLWWTRVPGNRLAEVHHLKPYRGRLRVWEQRGHGKLIFDQQVRISRDGRGGPDPQDVLHWRKLLRTLPSPVAGPSS